MTAVELNTWFSAVVGAPELIRSVLVWLVCICAVVALLQLIFKQLLSGDTRNLYAALKSMVLVMFGLGDKLVKSAEKRAALLQPYPCVVRFLGVIFMIHNYAASLFFILIAIVLVILSLLADQLGFWILLRNALLALGAMYVARLLFAQAERGRVTMRP